MKNVRAFSPGGREPALFKPISAEHATSILAERQHVEQSQCSYAFVEALGLKAPVRVYTAEAETMSVSIWELVVSERGAFIAEDRSAFIGERTTSSSLALNQLPENDSQDVGEDSGDSRKGPNPSGH